MDDRSVVARWKVCDDCRFAWVTRCVAAVYDILDLVLGDNPADDRSLPIIVAANQRSSAVVQFQCGISHWIRNAILTELRANGANDHSLWLSALHDKPANHHVVAGLNKSARGDVAELWAVGCPVEPVYLIRLRRVDAANCSPAAPTQAARPEAATRIPPDGRVIRCDRAIAPAPFALRAVSHVGLDLNPIRTGSEYCRSGQVYGERASVLLDWLMSRAVNLRPRKACVVGIKKYIPIDCRSRPVEIHAIRVDRLHIPSLSCRHDKVVRQIGVGRRKIGERGGHGDVFSGVIVLVIEGCLRRSRQRWSEHNVCAKSATGELRNSRSA